MKVRKLNERDNGRKCGYGENLLMDDHKSWEVF